MEHKHSNSNPKDLGNAFSTGIASNLLFASPNYKTKLEQDNLFKTHDLFYKKYYYRLRRWHKICNNNLRNFVTIKMYYIFT